MEQLRLRRVQRVQGYGNITSKKLRLGHHSVEDCKGSLRLTGAGSIGAIYIDNPNPSAVLIDVLAAVPAPSSDTSLNGTLVLWLEKHSQSFPDWQAIGCDTQKRYVGWQYFSPNYGHVNRENHHKPWKSMKISLLFPIYFQTKITFQDQLYHRSWALDEVLSPFLGDHEARSEVRCKPWGHDGLQRLRCRQLTTAKEQLKQNGISFWNVGRYPIDIWSLMKFGVLQKWGVPWCTAHF